MDECAESLKQDLSSVPVVRTYATVGATASGVSATISTSSVKDGEGISARRVRSKRSSATGMIVRTGISETKFQIEL